MDNQQAVSLQVALLKKQKKTYTTVHVRTHAYTLPPHIDTYTIIHTCLYKHLQVNTLINMWKMLSVESLGVFYVQLNGI